MAKKDSQLIAQEVVELEKTFLAGMPLVRLAKIATIKRAPEWKPADAEGNLPFHLITCEDLPTAGFIKTASRPIYLDKASPNLSVFSLQPYDFLITLHEQTFKMGIVNKELGENIIPDKNIILIRFKKDIQENAFSLYVFFKTALGGRILESIKTRAKKHLPLLSVTLLTHVLVPELNANIVREAAKAFEVESKFFGKIADIRMVIEGIFVDYLNRIQDKP